MSTSPMQMSEARRFQQLRGHGYLPLPEDGASALFQVINQRYLKSSTILTTNVGIAKAHMLR
ncbi:ATP-binding protein [Streptomyces massasporeus]|uniref:ATP-binding protein n=1 Tax=Streptomyces massasporeus TaxID=67324 RepID=UPI0036C1BFFB